MHYSHTRNLEVIPLARENHVDIICFPPHNSHKMRPLDKAFIGPLKIFYSVQTRASRHCLQIGEQFGNAHKRAATGDIAPNGCRATGLFPCHKNIFRPHDFPLASEDIDAVPVTHSALVNTSDQPSFSSVNLSPFTCAEAVRGSDCSPVSSLNQQPNTRGGTGNKITSSPYKKNLFGQFRKRKSNRSLNPKPIRLRRMLFLVLQRDGRKWFAGIQLCRHSIRFGL